MDLNHLLILFQLFPLIGAILIFMVHKSVPIVECSWLLVVVLQIQVEVLERKICWEK